MGQIKLVSPEYPEQQYQEKYRDMVNPGVTGIRFDASSRNDTDVLDDIKQ